MLGLPRVVRWRARWTGSAGLGRVSRAATSWRCRTGASGRAQAGCAGRRAQQDGGGQADADLAHDLLAGEDERAEHQDHDGRGGDDVAAGGGLAGSERLVVVAGCGPFLADAGDEEHFVVHRQAEQDGEHEDGQEGFDRAGLAEVEQVQSPAELEDGDQDAERRGGGGCGWGRSCRAKAMAQRNQSVISRSEEPLSRQSDPATKGPRAGTDELTAFRNVAMLPSVAAARLAAPPR